jgi:hypothetical protein
MWRNFRFQNDFNVSQNQQSFWISFGSRNVQLFVYGKARKLKIGIWIPKRACPEKGLFENPISQLDTGRYVLPRVLPIQFAILFQERDEYVTDSSHLISLPN